MNCPNCNSEMEQGFIQSSHGILWSKRKHKFSFWAGKDDIEVGAPALFGLYKESYHCPQCDTIVIQPSASK